MVEEAFQNECTNAFVSINNERIARFILQRHGFPTIVVLFYKRHKVTYDLVQ